MIQRTMTDDARVASNVVLNSDQLTVVVVDVGCETTPLSVVGEAETKAAVGVTPGSHAGNGGNHVASTADAALRMDRRASVGHFELRAHFDADLFDVTANSKSMDNGLDGLKRLTALPYYKHLKSNGKVMNGSRSETASEHRIRLEEVAPSHSFLEGTNAEMEQRSDDWRMPLDEFSSKKRGQNKADRRLPQSIRRYYKTQDELIATFEDLQMNTDCHKADNIEAARLLQQAEMLARVTFFCNLGLLIAKTAAAAMTGSLAVISSLIDSAVDLLSGTLFWWSSRAIKKSDPYRYPQGRTRLEPVAIVILSVVMSLASVQMIREAVEKIVAYATDPSALGPDFTVASIVICLLTIVTKLILFIVCKRLPNPTIQALAQDHRNDVVSNTVALGCGYAAYLWWKYLDPLGAIGISFYIICNWAITGHKQIKMLTGHTARPDFLKKLTWIALNHHAKINNIDTVRAFHFGSNFLVEVDIVLPEDMTHREAHDIGESLQMKLERLPEVERAFVHLDYETEHPPWSEHKVV